MQIEHKIILEEYDETKKEFSKLLTENIKRFNQNSLNRLLPIVEKLKKINSNKYQEYKDQIFEEFKNEKIVKYEYWLDCPFRTEKIKPKLLQAVRAIPKQKNIQKYFKLNQM